MNALPRLSRAVAVLSCAALLQASLPLEALAHVITRVPAAVAPVGVPAVGSRFIAPQAAALSLSAPSLGLTPSLAPSIAPTHAPEPAQQPRVPITERPGTWESPASALSAPSAAPSLTAAPQADDRAIGRGSAASEFSWEAAASASAVADAPAIARGFSALKRLFSTRAPETLTAPSAADRAIRRGSAASTLRREAAADDGKTPPPAPPAPPSAPDESPKGGFGLGKAAVSFIIALLVAQVGVEALGNAMPVLAQQVFGDFTVVAQLAVFSSIAGIIGRQFGPLVVQKFGLRKTYLATEVLRLVSISSLLGLLVAGHMTIPLMMGFYSLNGLLGGIAVTAETSIPPALVGQDQAKLEKFWTWEQTLLEIVGVLGPIIAGLAVDAYGPGPTLIAFPAAFAGAFAILFFTLRIPQRIELLRQADLRKKQEGGPNPNVVADAASLRGALKTGLVLGALGLVAMFFSGAPLLGWLAAGAALAGAAAWLARLTKMAKSPDAAALATTPENVLGGFFRKIAHGAKIVWATPLLRYSFLAYTAYMLLNPLLYGMIGPAFGRFIAGPEAMGGVFGLVAGLYSAGGLLGGLLMIREQARLKRAKDSGAMNDAQESESLRKSMLKWMLWTIPTLAAFGTMALHLPMLGAWLALPGWLSFLGPLTLPALALVPFGVAQVISMVKIRSYFQSKVPNPQDMADAMGFLGSASLAASTVAILALKFLFQNTTGSMAFLIIAGSMVPIGLAYWYITRKLDVASRLAATP